MPRSKQPRTYIAISDVWYDDDAIIGIQPPDLRVEAWYLFTALIARSSDRNTDGIVTRRDCAIVTVDTPLRVDDCLAALAASGVITIDGPTIEIVNYARWQVTAAEREARSEAGRKGGQASAQSRRQPLAPAHGSEPVAASPDGPQQPEPARTVEAATTGGFSASLVREHWHPSREWDQAVADRFAADLAAAGVTADSPTQVRAKAAEAVTGASDPSVGKVVGWWVRALPEKIADGKKAAAAAPVESPEATFEERAAFGLALMGLDKPAGGAA